MDSAILIRFGYVILLVIISYVIYSRKAIDFLGSLIMVFMGIFIIFSEGICWLLIIFLFLLLSLLATSYKKSYKKDRGLYQGRRTTKNVISNGIVAFLIVVLGAFSYLFNVGFGVLLVGGFIGAIATATADTLASEVGVLSQPRLITTFKKVEPGTDGAVSILGTLLAIIGSAVIGFAAFILGLLSNPLLALLIAVISGTIGCFMDSILGAAFERKDIINNEHVNLLGTATGAFVGILLSVIF